MFSRVDAVRPLLAGLAALMLAAPASALELPLPPPGEDVVEIEYQGRKVKGAIWVQPGHPDNSATIFLGYGRKKGGRVASGVGFSGNEIRNSQSMWVGSGAKLTKTGDRLIFDFRGSSPEFTNRATNTVLAGLKGMIAQMFLCYVWPDLPRGQAARGKTPEKAPGSPAGLRA